MFHPYALEDVALIVPPVIPQAGIPILEMTLSMEGKLRAL